MSEKKKIFLLGNVDYLKKSLMSLILRKDAHGDHDNNDKYEITCKKLYKASDDKQNPDMCLLVVEDGFSLTEVQQQIEDLHKTTKISTEKFIVVLPLGENPHIYPFISYTLGQLFAKLDENTGHHMPTNKRSADGPPSQTETDKSSRFWRYFTGSSTDNCKSLKGNHSDTKVNLVLLGMSGTGKSESGNTILGKTKFESKASSVPFTRECQVDEIKINGTRVRVIDTPDMFDDDIKPSVKNHHVTQCRQLCQSDPCVYLLVIQVGRFTDGERDILRKVEKAFGPEAKEQTIILFTHGENLQRAKMSLGDFLQDCEPELSEIVKQCGGRCVVFENKNSRQHQVTELMQTVNRMLNKW